MHIPNDDGFNGIFAKLALSAATDATVSFRLPAPGIRGVLTDGGPA
jgi:hypothetical protein